MKLFHLTLVALICFPASRVHAADERGNGGDAVDCRNGSSGTVELLDHFEGRNRYGFRVDMGAPGLAPLAKVELVLGRLARLDPERAERYLIQAREFEANANFWPDVELIDIPDSAHLAIPIRCAIKQVAIQKEPQVPEERYFTIASDLWNGMDSNSKAGLILHEIILRELKDQGHSDSVLTRYFNAAISRPEFAALTTKQYFELIKAAKVPASKIVGIPYRHGSLKAFPEHLNFDGNPWSVFGFLLDGSSCDLGDGQARECHGYFELDYAGNLTAVTISERSAVSVETSLGPLEVSGALRLSSTGTIVWASRVKDKTFDRLWQGQQDVRSKGPAWFDAQGRLVKLEIEWFSDCFPPTVHTLGECKAKPRLKSTGVALGIRDVPVALMVSLDGDVTGITNAYPQDPPGIRELCMLNPRDGSVHLQSFAPGFATTVTFDSDYHAVAIDTQLIRLPHAGANDLVMRSCGIPLPTVQLHSNGFVRGGCLASEAQLVPEDAPTTVVTVKQGTPVQFNEQGYWVRKN